MPFHTLKSGRQVKLGRLIPTTPPKAVKLESFFHRPANLMGLPENLDYWTKAASSIRRMYLNDRLGCCVITGKMHQLGVYSANNFGADKTILATDAEVQNQYVSICGAGDNGCYITAVLNTWMQKGLVAGGKIYPLDGYAAVEPSNLVLLKTAIHIFGSVTFGIDLPSAWLNTDDGEQWDVTNSGSVGGHDVCALGYDHRGVIIATWGGTRVITWAALESRAYIDECYVQLAPAWYQDARLAPSGFDVAGLKQAMEDFKSGKLPDDPDPTVPPPPPAPPVPAPPTPAGPITVTLPLFTGGVKPSDYITDPTQPTAYVFSLAAQGPIVVSLGAAHHLMGAVPWALILALAAKYLPIILADLAAGKTWQEILADILGAGKKSLPA